MSLSVLKIGGSVLTTVAAYATAAEFVERRLRGQVDTRLVVVVSAEEGLTDELSRLARTVSAAPDPAALDLLWSTGELRSVALLVLALQARGVRAAAANVHQTGLARSNDPNASIDVHPAHLHSLLATNHVVVVPGFLACRADAGIVSLGRGGSDLTAVLLAAALSARRCELIKDVDGYFADDPKAAPDADHLSAIDWSRALDMAASGCELVQQAALEMARARGVALVVRGLSGVRETLVHEFEGA